MTLAQMQARFFEFKGKLAVGQIQEEEFKRELEKLRFQDAHGRWWMIGAQSGRWFYYDGARWMLGDPPEPPPPALGMGEPDPLIPPATPARAAAYPAQSAAAPSASTTETISVPYRYAPAQTTPARSVAPQPTAPAQPSIPAPARTNGGGYGPAAPTSAATPLNAGDAVSPSPKPSISDTLKQDLGQVHLPHVSMPHVQAPNLHLPPQFVAHTPAPIRKYQSSVILIGAVVVGLALVAILWLGAGSLFGKPSTTAPKTSIRQTGTPGGQNVDNLLRVGDDLARKSQFEPALAQYQAAAKYAPNDASVYTRWARALALTGRIGEAISTAQKATKLDPTSANAFAELTRALAWGGQTQQAINAGEKAIALDAQNATAQALLAEAYLRAGQTNQAQTTADRALELDDSNPETHRAAGWVAILSGRKDEGVSEWKRVVELAPDTFLYYYEFGLVYANYLKDAAAAIPSFQRAIQLYPPYIPSYTALGRGYLDANQPGPAILQFQKALTLDPNSADAFLGLGQAFQVLQKCPQAIPYYQKALELNKGLAAATKGLEDCGALAKGSAPTQPQPSTAVIQPLATALPQATAAPIRGGGSSTAPKATPAAGAATANRGQGRIYFPLYDGQYRIFSANPDGSDRRLLTELASSPAVSADGARLLFYSWISDQRGIHRIDASGSGDVNISLRAEDSLPSWSPDGTKYVYSTRAGLGGDINKRAYTLRVGSVGSRPRQDPPPLVEQAQYPAWGPDNTIVFRDCGFPSDSCGLAIVNADGGGKKTLTNINSTAPAWSPDGSRIVFMSNVAGNWDLYTVNADGGSPERLTDNFGNDGLPVYSPDGSKIAFLTDRDGKWSIYQIDPNGENEVKLFDLGGQIAGTVQGNSPAQPGQSWLEQRISWR